MAGRHRAHHAVARHVRHGPRTGVPLRSGTTDPRGVVAAITIGAAPRPDLTGALRAALTGMAEVVESGALDGLEPDDIPAASGTAGRPLVTQAPGGRSVVVDEGWLAPRVASLVARAETDGAAAVVLLCAGGFDAITARIPLIRPRDAALARLRTMGARQLLVLVPIAGQIAPAEAGWSAAGFEATAVVGGPGDVARPSGREVGGGSPPDAVVLDFVGHPADAVRAAAAAIAPTPLIDLSTEMVAAVVATMRR